ncbi:MAG TPA: hypothetical protein VGL72_28230 [Bryobacteraceae bacterium]
MPDVVILGCGYTGSRVARRFLDQRASVIVTTRTPSSLEELAARGAKVLGFDSSAAGRLEIPEGALVLHSIPEHTPQLLASLAGRPVRMVYLSTTGVYGAIRDVDETTLPAPGTDREKARLAAEEDVRSGPWSSLILRPAAIYGPDRGVHVAMREGRFRLAGAGANFVSRIHVDDLAAHVEAALLSELTGAYPVADELPCTSREIAEYCAKLFNLPMPISAPRDSLHETRWADRRVDGRAIRSLLGINLRYPTYREGLAQAGLLSSV